MKTIHKYIIDDPNENEILIYNNAKFLSVQIQNGQAVAWFLVDTESIKGFRTFKWFYAGEELPKNIETDFKYLATIQKDWVAFHLFERA